MLIEDVRDELSHERPREKTESDAPGREGRRTQDEASGTRASPGRRPEAQAGVNAESRGVPSDARSPGPPSRRPPASRAPEPSVLDRLAAEVAGAARGGAAGPGENGERDEDVDALLDKLSRQLEDDPSAWRDLVSSLGFPVAAEPTAPCAPAKDMLSIQPQPGFVIKTTITKLPEPAVPPPSTNTAAPVGRTHVEHPAIKEVGKPGVKVFINLCHSAEIPAPPPATDEDIRSAINAEDNASWKVPMSLAEPSKDRDKAGHPCLVFSACVHTTPYQKAEDDFDFKLFLIELAVEWVEEKSGLKLSRQFQLPRLRSKGPPAKHWIRKESKRKGISEVRPTAPGGRPTRSGPLAAAGHSVVSPDYFVSEVKGEGKDVPTALIAVIHLPGLKSIGPSARLDVTSNSLSFEYAPQGSGAEPPTRYSLIVQLDKPVEVSTATATFSRRSQVCRVRMPLAAR